MTLPCPARTTSALRAPIRRSTGPAAFSSSAAVRPLIARTIPPGRTTPMASSASRGKRSDRTCCYHISPYSDIFGAAAQHGHVGEPQFGHALGQEPAAPFHGLEQGDRHIGKHHGQDQAGQPRPRAEIHERARAVCSMSSATTAQFSRCRSQSRGTSRGPSRPWATPRVARMPGVRRGGRQRRPEDARGAGGHRRRARCCVRDHGKTGHYWAGKITTRRFGSSPSDSLRRPAAATASCTIFRSNGDMASSAFGWPVRATSSATVRP